MTDQQITAAERFLATKLMGWHLVPFYPGILEWCSCGDGTHANGLQRWHPFSNAHHAAVCREKAQKDWCITLRWEKSSGLWSCHVYEGMDKDNSYFCQVAEEDHASSLAVALAFGFELEKGRPDAK